MYICIYVCEEGEGKAEGYVGLWAVGCVYIYIDRSRIQKCACGQRNCVSMYIICNVSTKSRDVIL